MFQRTAWTLAAVGRGSQRRTHADVAKVLYKKRSNHIQNVSVARPDVVTAVLNTPPSLLADAVHRATSTRELDRDALIQLLKKYRVFKRLDLAEVAIQAYCDAGRSLSPHHITLIMAHANEAKQWRTATKFWLRAVKENKVRPMTHSALLQTMRVSGRWKDAVAHLQTMVGDGIPVDAHALHTVMNTARQAAPWTVGLSTFSLAVQHGGTRPNELVYLVLLRCIAQSRLPARWHYSLSILSQLLTASPKNSAASPNGNDAESVENGASPSSASAVEARLEVSAGMVSAVMESAVSCGRWKDAVNTYKIMEPYHIAVNKDTFRVLMSANPRCAQHCVRVLAAAHQMGSPITEEMYRIVFRSLLLVKPTSIGVDSVIALAQSEMQRAVEDPGNPNVETRAITLALLDVVLDHADPVGVDQFLHHFVHQIETVLPEATRGLGVLGDPTQRWIAEGGRLAVVDHNALYSKYLESLRFHYDHVLIPISTIRTLQRRTETVLNGTASATRNRWILHRLRELLLKQEANSSDGSAEVAAHTTLSDFMHVLPLHHELFAHQHIQPLLQEASRKDGDLKLLRRSAAEAAAELLLESGSHDDEPRLQVRSSQFAPTQQEDGLNSRSRYLTTGRDHDRTSQSEASDMRPDEPPFFGERSWLNTSEKVISVAVMLKKLNPDVEVHVVSSSSQQLHDVERWNAHTKTFHKVPLLLHSVPLFPRDLMEKAPPAPQHHAKNSAGRVDDGRFLVSNDEENVVSGSLSLS